MIRESVTLEDGTKRWLVPHWTYDCGSCGRLTTGMEAIYRNFRPGECAHCGGYLEVFSRCSK